MENRSVRISVIRVVLGRFISSCVQYCNLQNLYSWYIAILCYIFTLTNFTLSSKFYSNYYDGAEVKGNHCNRRLCKSPDSLRKRCQGSKPLCTEEDWTLLNKNPWRSQQIHRLTSLLLSVICPHPGTGPVTLVPQHGLSKPSRQVCVLLSHRHTVHYRADQL